MPKIDLGKVVGEDAKITIGTTTTLDAGNDATVENVGTKSDAVLNFGIPKGYTPIKGTDYWTENDIDEIHDYVDEQISAIDLTPYSEKTETGHSIELSMNAQTYVMTATLKNVSGDVLNTQTIDLPLETMVVSGSYDSATKEVVLTLQSGSTIRFSVSDLVDGLVSESDLEVTLANYVSRETFDSIVGDLDDLSTEDKTTLVNAINEVVTNMGDLSIKELETGVYNIDALDDGIYVQEATRTIKLNLPRRSDGHDQGEEYVQYELLGILIKASSVSDEPSIMGHYIFTTMDENNNYVQTIVQGYYEKFEDPAGVEEPIIIGEYETAYNAAKKYTNSVTGDLANLDTTDKTNLVSAINEVASSGSDVNILTSRDIDFANMKKGVYAFGSTSIHFISINARCSHFATGGGNYVYYSNGIIIVLQDITADLTNGQPVATTFGFNGGKPTLTTLYVDRTSTNGLSKQELTNDELLSLSGYQTISGVKTFTTLPESTVVPTNDNQFTNKKYVDDAVASAGENGDVGLYRFSYSGFPLGRAIDMTSTLSDIFEDIINDAYNKSYKTILVIKQDESGSGDGYNIDNAFEFISNNRTLQNKPSSVLLIGQANAGSLETNVLTGLKTARLNITGTWTDDVFSVTRVLWYGENVNLLPTNGYASYTPNTPYSPSTKKYVDDSIAAAVGDINTVLATLTTVEEGE